MTWPASERDEIRQRVNNFGEHQEKMMREREDYYFANQSQFAVIG
jgi:hypothetical protein